MEMSDAEDLLDSGRVTFGMGRYVEALEIAERALIAAPDDLDVLLLKANILSALDRDPEALELNDRVVRMAPDLPRGYGAKASTLYGMERFTEAEELFRTALSMRRLGPRDQDPNFLLDLEFEYLGLADTLIGQGRRNAAIDVLQEGIAACDAKMLKDRLKKVSREQKH